MFGVLKIHVVSEGVVLEGKNEIVSQKKMQIMHTIQILALQ